VPEVRQLLLESGFDLALSPRSLAKLKAVLDHHRGRHGKIRDGNQSTRGRLLRLLPWRGTTALDLPCQGACEFLEDFGFDLCEVVLLLRVIGDVVELVRLERVVLQDLPIALD